MDAAYKISSELSAIAEPEQATILSRFFKTAPGEYGEGDRFLGIRVPQTRAIVKKYCKLGTFDDVDLLTKSTFHEERLAGFLLLVELYNFAKKKKDESEIAKIVDFYRSILDRGNNWDLVDLVAPKILGDRLSAGKDAEPILMQLAASDNLWKQRVSIVATLPLIKKGMYDLTLDLALYLIPHEHDLIHKATGWMLREVGKKDERMLLAFLDHYCTKLPRTTLRYAIEKLAPRHRLQYMTMKEEASRDKSIPRKEEKHIPMSHRLTLPKKNKK
ncbi:MAG: DNA alkylation repair protein [Bacteroides sp.]|nr:DNA alkylation repair protein [Bacteroides sp.]